MAINSNYSASRYSRLVQVVQPHLNTIQALAENFYQSLSADDFKHFPIRKEIIEGQQLGITDDKKLLLNQPWGTYYLRFSSQPDCLTIVGINRDDGTMGHSRIPLVRCQNKIYLLTRFEVNPLDLLRNGKIKGDPQLLTQNLFTLQQFCTIYESVGNRPFAFSAVDKTPYFVESKIDFLTIDDTKILQLKTEVETHPSFHSDCTSLSQAVATLENNPVGTYLIRRSGSLPAAFVLSYIAIDKNVVELQFTLHPTKGIVCEGVAYRRLSCDDDGRGIDMKDLGFLNTLERMRTLTRPKKNAE